MMALNPRPVAAATALPEVVELMSYRVGYYSTINASVGLVG